MNIKQSALAAFLLLSPLTFSSCDVSATTGDTDTIEELTLEQEDDVRLDTLINDYTGNLIEFPVDYNQHKLESLGKKSISEFIYELQRPGMESNLPFSTEVMDAYQYGDTVYIVSDHFEDVEFVARAIELIKRKLPAAYENLISDVPGMDYTVFSFHDSDTGFGDWANMSHGRSADYDSTGGKVSFIVGDRAMILYENDPGFNIDPIYAVGIPEEGAEEYALIMKELFLTFGLHESLHAFYNTNYPNCLFNPNNDGDPRNDIEHLNITSYEKEFIQGLNGTDFYKNYLVEILDNWYDTLTTNGTLTNSQADAVRDYRPF